MNDQVLWTQVIATLYSIIGIERGDTKLEHACLDKLEKKGDIRYR